MSNQNWNIDPTHSSISFSVRHLVFAKVRGRFGEWQGSVHFDEERPTEGSVEVTIDANSIETGVADRDTHLRSADFLDVERFPTITFKSRHVEALGGGRLRVQGDLTIHGVTREVALDAEYAGQAKDPWGNQRVAFTAQTSVDRGEFGLKWNQALETGGVLVGERIDIEIEAQAVQMPVAEAV